jgi:hypothetical protein
VREQQLDRSLAGGPEETGLERSGTDALTVVVGDPGAAEVVQEGSTVVREDHLLLEAERLDRGVVAATVPVPRAEQPRRRREVGVQVGRDLVRHAFDPTDAPAARRPTLVA